MAAGAADHDAIRPRWAHFATHFVGSGMGEGADFTVIKKHLKYYESRGMTDRYAALLAPAAGC